MKKIGKIVKVFIVLWFLIIFYFLGYFVGHKNIVFESNYKPTLTNLELKKSDNVDFSAFTKAWEIISEKYAGTYSPQKLVNGAIKGMVEALGDPYSSFMDTSQNSKLMQDLSGEFEGIGAELTGKNDKIVVVAPLADTPAEKAGLKANDQILQINGEDTANMALNDAIDKIRGPSGTEVTLLINREGFTVPREFKITRAKITVSSVKWEMKGDIGYIEISQFGDDTSSLAQKAAKELAQKHPKAIILDLRNNPGGYLDSAVDVTSLFVPSGSVVVKEQYKDGHKDELKTTFDPILKDYKVIVLVNEGSASAAEITAGALQDLRGSILVGKKTFGKGTVQELDNLDSSAVLRLTVAHWLTPKDRAINKEGIKPDIEVELTDQDQAAGRDPQLDRAIEEANK